MALRRTRGGCHEDLVYRQPAAGRDPGRKEGMGQECSERGFPQPERHSVSRHRRCLAQDGEGEEAPSGRTFYHHGIRGPQMKVKMAAGGSEGGMNRLLRTGQASTPGDGKRSAVGEGPFQSWVACERGTGQAVSAAATARNINFPRRPNPHRRRQEAAYEELCLPKGGTHVTVSVTFLIAGTKHPTPAIEKEVTFIPAHGSS